MNNTDRAGNFFALLFRMKNIVRWGLMPCTKTENLSEHSLETAFLAHALSVIGVTHFSRTYNPERIAAIAMYHDMTEVLTGDLPTPVKYYNDEMRIAYKQIEKAASDKLFSFLNNDMCEYYEKLITAADEQEENIIKAADKLSAHIKCLSELKSGNLEFETAAESTFSALKKNSCPELDYFVENYLDSFSKDLDNVTL
ncbi:MAG: 5'-deoxynucleotidase [Clostridia bacterium]|nr:5'-deoxynucleotidase [Clostridia bacterium]